ncbi:ComF family protein [Staphylococcus agnetis]|uniref:ComF family protein n=1 Tax=Staphylococcus agnetis TaxID=985762 RepID=UPI0018E510D6|nr:ComF family protein [Staphylococcus agnetis]MCO4341735.1 ComF family protein [Staphylococcus agnetis]MCO4342869.1 ComF family protein [Staphylococcus agnetis]MCO4345482.1 ComF family protein [Staphylococcus agnetis]MCO4351106.1 ComF family protein [Staphylococcus agnetis]MCO4352171.1 ComF family protein [Staphylococcus agnetis]
MRCHICHSFYDELFTLELLFQPTNILCEHCRNLLEQCIFNSTGRCSYCLGEYQNSKCINCDSVKYVYTFDSIDACFHYEGFYKTLFHQYKFLGDVALAQVIAKYISIKAQHYDYIIPVPSVKENDIERTFNPVQVILSALSIDFEDCLKMHRRPKQYQLTLKERMSLSNDIEVEGDINLENKRILLVDDIYTTGRTAHNVAVKLFQRKVRKLSMLTFAR